MAGPRSLPEEGLTELVLAHRLLRQRLGELEADLDASVGGWDPVAVQTYAEARRRWTEAVDHMAAVIRRLQDDVAD